MQTMQLYIYFVIFFRKCNKSTTGSVYCSPVKPLFLQPCDLPLGFCTHCCVLYVKVGWSSFYSRRMGHWYIFICKAIVHQLLSCLFSLLTAKSVNSFNLQSLGCIMYKIPPTHSVLSKRAVIGLVLLTTIDKII